MWEKVRRLICQSTLISDHFSIGDRGVKFVELDLLSSKFSINRLSGRLFEQSNHFCTLCPDESPELLLSSDKSLTGDTLKEACRSLPSWPRASVPFAQGVGLSWRRHTERCAGSLPR